MVTSFGLRNRADDGLTRITCGPHSSQRRASACCFPPCHRRCRLVPWRDGCCFSRRSTSSPTSCCRTPGWRSARTRGRAGPLPLLAQLPRPSRRRAGADPAGGPAVLVRRRRRLRHPPHRRSRQGHLRLAFRHHAGSGHPWFWTLIGIDQALHHLTGFALSIYMAANRAVRETRLLSWRGVDPYPRPSLRGAKRRSNPSIRRLRTDGLLRFARNDGGGRRVIHVSSS